MNSIFFKLIDSRHGAVTRVKGFKYVTLELRSLVTVMIINDTFRGLLYPLCSTNSMDWLLGYIVDKMCHHVLFMCDKTCENFTFT